MNRRKKRNTDKPVYLNAESLAAALDCGRLTADRIGKAAGARVQYGRCVRYDLEKVKAYLNQLAEEQGA